MIETPRLLLRPLALDDLDALALMYADAEVQRFTGGEQTRAVAAERLAQVIALHAQQGFGMLAVVEKSSARFLGRAGFLVQQMEGAREVELAYGLARETWGKGYATEAIAAARDWGFAHLAEPRFISLIHPDNSRSIRVAEKIGSRYAKDVEFMGQRVRLYVNDRAPDPRS